MFIHNFKYFLKTLLKNKMLIFWTFAFPIIVGTLFNMAFSDIENKEKLDIIDIAIVENENFNSRPLFKEIFKLLSDTKSNDRLFNIEYTTIDNAKELLDNNKIIGYLLLDDKDKIVISNNGIKETVFKQVVEEITEYEKVINTVSNNQKDINLDGEQDCKLMYAELYQKIMSSINIKNISKSNLSYTMIEFYTLIAMACLYGGILGMVAINQSLANMSDTGKRIAMSPTSKIVIISSSVLASFLVQLIGIALLFIYTVIVLHVNYGDNLPLIFLLSLIGCLAGLSFGIVISCLLKANDNVKTGILISITMLECFFSGMMGITMKYIIDKNVPILNKLNPASMITDGFYSLYYYDTSHRFYFNVVSLLIFALIMISISLISLRRQQYDSI